MDSADAACVICFSGDESQENLIVFCDGCNKGTHQQCYGIKSIPDESWYCISCFKILQTKNNGSAATARFRKNAGKRECCLCPNDCLQGGFIPIANGEKWAHTGCVQLNPLCTFVGDGHGDVHRSADISAIPIDNALTQVCELCGLDGYLGCISCAGNCQKSVFHVSCAMLKGYSSGYLSTKCPNCACIERILAHRTYFRELLSRLMKKNMESNGPNFDKEWGSLIIERVDSGAFDRTPFQGALELLSKVENRNDPNLVVIFRLLARAPGDRTSRDIADFVIICAKLLSGVKEFSGELKRLYNMIVGNEAPSENLCDEKYVKTEEDLEREIFEKSEKCLELKTIDRIKNCRRVLSGYCDSILLYFDVPGLCRTIFSSLPILSFSYSERREVVAFCQVLIRSSTSKIAELYKLHNKRESERLFIKKDMDIDDDITTSLLQSQAPYIRYFGSVNLKRLNQVKIQKTRGTSSSSPSRKSKKRKESSKGKPKDEVDLGTKALGEVLSEPSTLPHSQYQRMSKLRSSLDQNSVTEPYIQGKWMVAPYTRRPYKKLGSYIPAEGLSSRQKEDLMRILISSKKPLCDESLECSQPVPYSVYDGTFETKLPCKGRRVACSVSDLGRGRALELGKEVEERDAWGMDCYTRKNIQAVMDVVLRLKAEITHRIIIQRLLLPVVNSQASYRAHNFAYSLLSILKGCGKTYCVADESQFESAFGELEEDYAVEESEDTSARVSVIISRFSASHPLVCTTEDRKIDINCIRLCCAALLYAVRNWGLDCFRLHPKGLGVFCATNDGLCNGRYVTEYLGELFPPWRWFERTDAIKNVQRATAFKSLLPDFYNITLERHHDDTDGYDLAYIDPGVRGNFASRLSHSCEPNCATVVMVKDGRYVVTVYTLGDVSFGEELTFDYFSVTEDENEFRAAICLCGSVKCRGSFLYYAGLGAFADIMVEHHQFLDRYAMVVKACGDPNLTSGDKEKLERYGIKSAILQGLPHWLVKWTALVLNYVDFEENELRHRLCLQVNELDKQLAYDEGGANLEARGVAENRKQNVAISLSKIRNFLSAKYGEIGDGSSADTLSGASLDSAPAPLKILTTQQKIDLLWNSDDSIAAQVINCALVRISEEDLRTRFMEIEETRKASKVTELKTMRSNLRMLRDTLWSIKHSECFVSAGDLVTWWMYTDYVSSSVQYTSLRSQPILVRNVDIGRDGSTGATRNEANSKKKNVNETDHPSALNSHLSEEIPDSQEYQQAQKAISKAALRGGAGDSLNRGAKRQCEDSNVAAQPLINQIWPYWYQMTSPEKVTLSACENSKFSILECNLPAECSDDFKSFTIRKIDNFSETSGPSFAVLNSPMVGTSIFYLFRGDVLLNGSDAADAPSFLYRICLIEPRRPEDDRVPARNWKIMGVFYGFLDAIPGTTGVEARDARNQPIKFFTFTLDFFRTNVSFGSEEENILGSEVSQDGRNSKITSRARTQVSGDVSLGRGYHPLDPVFSLRNESKSKLWTKKYQSGFVLGQMVFWSRQTIAAPDASLSAERRGSLSLPDVDSSFSCGNSYKDRKSILLRLKETPHAMWPTGTHWSFKNKLKVYGTPWADECVDPGSLNRYKVIRDVTYHINHGKPPSWPSVD